MTDDERLSGEQIQRQVSAILADSSRTVTTTGTSHPGRETLDNEMREIKDNILRMGSYVEEAIRAAIQALIGHDAVLEAAVVPKEDGDGLLKPKAFIVLKPGKTAANGLEEQLREHVKAKAGVWKYPRWIAFVDGLPKTATGKIQRFKLREG